MLCAHAKKSVEHVGCSVCVNFFLMDIGVVICLGLCNGVFSELRTHKKDRERPCHLFFFLLLSLHTVGIEFFFCGGAYYLERD